MANFIQLARFYFNDKDIEDILGNPRFSSRMLLQIARQRGIFLSPDDTKEEVVRYLSLQHFDWKGLTALTTRLNRDESEERRATVQLENVASLDAIEVAVSAEKPDLEKDRQAIKVAKVGGRIVINGTYTDIDPTRSRAMQREERQYHVEVEMENGTVKAQYTHSGKAADLIARIVKRLQADDSTKQTSLKRISLSGIKDAALRTDFLLRLRSGMAGFRALDVLDLNVDHRFEPEKAVAYEKSQVSEESTEDSDTAEEAEIKSMVRSAALHGNGLLTSEFYQRLREKGYYIYKVVWTGRELAGEGRVMEFEAGFDDPVRADGFSYDVKRVLPTDAEKEEGRTQHELLMADRPRVRRIIADAAYAAFDSICCQGEESEVNS